MRLFQVNLLLAGGWCALFGIFDLGHFVLGFLLAFAVLSLSSPMYGQQPAYFKRVLLAARLGAYFLYELTVSSFQVAWDVMTPTHRSRPAIVAVPLDIEEPIQITVLANLISLTPGSLSLDVSPDRKTLYVHEMFVDDPDETRTRIKTGFERLVREAMQ
jgi:multicomponent Na+:H+ antiporter subunit E